MCFKHKHTNSPKETVIIQNALFSIKEGTQNNLFLWNSFVKPTTFLENKYRSIWELTGVSFTHTKPVINPDNAWLLEHVLFLNFVNRQTSDLKITTNNPSFSECSKVIFNTFEAFDKMIHLKIILPWPMYE